MKLIIKNKKRALKLWLPLSIIKMKIFKKLLIDKSEIVITENEKTINLMKDIYKTLKKHRKKYGSFELISISNNDDEIFKIIV